MSEPKTTAESFERLKSEIQNLIDLTVKKFLFAVTHILNLLK